MKILQVTNGFPPTARAGVEQYTYLLSRTLRDSGHDVQVLCREEAHTLPERTILEDTVDGIPVRRVVNNFFDVVRFEQYYQNEGITTIFLETVEEMQPDIIHFQHAIGLSLTMLEAATETKIPFLLTLHDYWFICPIVQLLTTNLELCSGPHLGADCFDCMGPVDGFTRNVHRLPVYAQLKKRTPEPIWNLMQRTATRLLNSSTATRIAQTSHSNPETLSPFVQRMERMQRALSHCSSLITPSQFVKDVYVNYGVPADNIRVVSLGLDLALWSEAQSGSAEKCSNIRFVYIGTLLRHKGVDILLQAFLQLENREANAELFIYGYGIPEEDYESQLRKLAQGNAHIHFMGAYDNQELPKILADVDVAVIPARWHETFSIVTREALLAKKFVIASEVGAIPEVIEHGKNGLLVPPGDIDKLHSALQKAIDSPELLENARNLKANSILSIQEHTKQIEEIYLQLLLYV